MLPFILGGVAIAAVGYGLKKYCDENDCYDKIENTLDKALSSLDDGIERAYQAFERQLDKLALDSNYTSEDGAMDEPAQEEPANKETHL